MKHFHTMKHFYLLQDVSDDGCVYIKVDFPKCKTQTSADVIHGKEQMTVYAQIDWTKSPPEIEEQHDPPAYEEEEDVMGQLPPLREEMV